MFQAELVLDINATLGEGPCWDEDSQKLIWVDIEGCTVNHFDPVTGVNASTGVGKRVGAAVQRDQGGMILALDDGFYAFDPDSRDLVHLHDPEPGVHTNRFNDGKCDPYGRFWAGSMVLKGRKERAALYRMDPDGSVQTMETGITISNGLAFDEARSLMYYIDSVTKQIARYDYDGQSGEIRNKIVAFSVADQPGVPDGMTIDDEGMLWVAFFNGGKVVRFAPDSGVVLEEVAVASSKVTSCSFGGRDYHELYITTARADDDQYEPHSGGLYKVRLPVSGVRSHRFSG